MRKALVGATVAGLGLVTTACQPLELGLTVRRDGVVQYVDEADGASTNIRVRGRVTCTRPSHVDLFVTLTQGLEFQSVGFGVNCPGSEGVRLPWFHVSGTFPSTGQAEVRVRACTNSSNPINRDCITVERVVDFTERRPPLPPMIPAPPG